MTERPVRPAAPDAAAPRAAAALALARVRSGGQSLTRALAPGAGQALTQELVYGALRELPRLEALLGRLLNRPLGPGDRDLEALLLIGLQELLHLRTPPHAAVAATVEACRTLRKPGKTGLVNALLRRFLRERATLLADCANAPGVYWCFPDWLLERLRQDWPADWEAIVAASNGRPSLGLRVNRLQVSRDDYLARLAAAGLTARPLSELSCGLILDPPCPTRDLPGFAAGWVSVQDPGAQLAALLLAPRPGQRVLDACAAPGGKTAHLLEQAGNDLELIALDRDAARLEPLRANLTRLGLRATVIQGDASAPDGDWTARPFDRILLDVPCSATGVIRRHPDIKWLRRPEDIPVFAARQSALLEAVWPLLAPNGRLLYATCSLLAAENHWQIADFLARHPEAREWPLPPEFGGRPCPHGRQWLPEPGLRDGFFYALLGRPAV